MNTIDFFHHVIRTESAVFVADVEQFGHPYAENALRRGIEILEGRIRQLAVDPAAVEMPSPDPVAPTLEPVASALRAVPSAEPVGPAPLVPPVHGMPMQIAETVVAEAFGIPVNWLHSPRRETRFNWPVQVAMYVCYMATNASSSEIARYFGRKDHTAALYARDKVQDFVEQGKAGLDVAALIAKAKAALRPADTRSGDSRQAAVSA